MNEDTRKLIQEMRDALEALMGRHPTWKDQHAATMAGRNAVKKADAILLDTSSENGTTTQKQNNE
jgi:hypothetical protein